MNRVIATIALAMPLVLLAGCVERTIKITSQPSGALVYLNDEEVGRTPTEVRFTFYGDYGVILRKEGYQTLEAHRKINAPWYQLPPADIFADLLIPTTIRDQHAWDFELQPQQLPTKQELLERAEDFRGQALRTPASEPAATQPAETQPVVDTQP